jgi:hypothetical protein
MCSVVCVAERTGVEVVLVGCCIVRAALWELELELELELLELVLTDSSLLGV